MAGALTKTQRALVLLGVTVTAITFGMVTDPALSEARVGDLGGALILSPFLVAVMGGVGAPPAWMPALWPLGCCFWPLYFWLSYQSVEHALRFAWIAVLVLTSIAYFGVLTKFFGAMSA